LDAGTDEQRKKALASMSKTANGVTERTIADAKVTAEGSA
jgi:hypothetical protein